MQPRSGRPFHIFDGFALVNVLICSAGPKGSSIGRSTPTMRGNCLAHFTATRAILQPTILVLQGKGVARWTAPVLETRKIVSPELIEASRPGGRVLVCRFSHPSARGSLRWGDRLDAPYLLDVVEPTLNLALRNL